MKFWSRKAAQSAARPILSRVASFGGGALGSAPSFEAQYREAYLANAIAARAVRMVAEAVGSAPLSVSDAALAALVQGGSGGQALLETLAAQLLLHGNAYVQIMCGADDRPGMLFALRPERVSVEADAQGWPIAYRYRAGGQMLMLEALDGAGRPALIHLQALNPGDDHYGAGCLSAVMGAVAAHNAANRWNRALLDNAARPSGALVHDGDKGLPLTPEQFDRLKAELTDGFAGGANAGRPLLLEGGLKWQPLSLSPADMDFLALKDSAAREIATGFGVPPMLLGLPGDATYANYREANRALWRQTILPLADKILGGIARALAPWFAGASLRVDVDKVPAMAEDRERLWAMVASADWLTREEKRAMVGLG
jgi:HK97 family phage portal protein